MPIYLTDVHNLTATSAPTVNDDRNDGYHEGSRWVNTLTGTEYVCRAATVGAAQWEVSPYAGTANVAGLKYALGIAGIGITPGRTALIERFSKRPLIAADIAAGLAVANADFEAAGTNMTSALVTHNVARSGVRLTSAGAASDQCILQPRSDSGASRWGVGFLSDNELRWGGSIRFVAVTALKFKLALAKTNTLDLGTDADQVGIYYDVATDGNIKGITSIAGTDVITSTGLAAAAGTEYRWEIVLDSSRIARIYIGVGTGAMNLVFTSAALTTAITLYPFIEWQSSSGAKAADVRYEYLEFNNA